MRIHIVKTIDKNSRFAQKPTAVTFSNKELIFAGVYDKIKIKSESGRVLPAAIPRRDKRNLLVQKEKTTEPDAEILLR